MGMTLSAVPKPRWLVEMAVGLILGITLSGCAQAAATPVGVTPPISGTSTPLISVATLEPVTPVEVAASRTPLPSVTPTSVGPVLPSATSALIAAATNTTGAPLATSASLLPGTAPAFELELPAGWKYGYTLLPVRERSVATT